MTQSIRSALTLGSMFFTLAACSGSDPVTVDSSIPRPLDSPMCGTCGVCAPAITLQIDITDAVATAVSGAAAEALTCRSADASTTCESSDSLAPGTYVYDVTALGRSKRVSIVVERGTPGACCDCGYLSTFEQMTFVDDGGVPGPTCTPGGDYRTCVCAGGAGTAITLACATAADDDTCYTYSSTCTDEGFISCTTANFAAHPLLEARCRTYCATDGGVPTDAPCDGW